MRVLVQDDPVVEVAVADAGMRRGLLATVPVLVPAASAALIALPSACVTATAGIVGEAATIEPVRVGAAPVALWAMTRALAPSVWATCSRCR